MKKRRPMDPPTMLEEMALAMVMALSLAATLRTSWRNWSRGLWTSSSEEMGTVERVTVTIPHLVKVEVDRSRPPA